MASSFIHCLSSVLFSSLVLIHMIIITPSLAKTTSFRPKALVLPVSKDASTLQYLTSIKQRTPPVTTKLILDLGGEFLWVDCEKGYVSSAYKPAICDSAQCKLAKSISCFDCGAPQRPGCSNNTCAATPIDTVSGSYGPSGPLGEDHVSLRSTEGSHPGKLVSVPNFLFVCGQTDLFKGLAKGVLGFAGFGRKKIGIPSQFASAFGFTKIFALCLPSSTRSYGAIFLGPGPYILQPGVDVSKSLIYTPLLLNPETTGPIYIKGKPSSEYFINVTAIKINEYHVPLNTSFLVIDKDGNGGTKISTVKPYTVLESSIYNAFIRAYLKLLPAQIPRVTPVAPFGVCINSSQADKSRVGPVPIIDFVLQSESVYWRVLAANSMVQVSKDVLCLGFVDGGERSRTSIVIGGHQLQDNLLQFDLGYKRIGFSNSLLSRQTSCANFNFKSTA